jgi:biopolymer transport protein ExbD/biopolymer transport protein TolR
MDAGGNRSGVRSDINITPLVDVVLVLLIIFMVVTPMLQRGKHVELPKAKHAVKGQENNDPLFITVVNDGKVYAETDEVNPDQLLERLKAAQAAQKRVLIKADQDAEYGKIRPVLDKASKAKLKNVGLAAGEIKEKK